MQYAFFPLHLTSFTLHLLRFYAIITKKHKNRDDIMDYINEHHGNHSISDKNNGYIYRYARSDGYTLQSHLHTCYEFVHFISGNPMYTVEGHEYRISPGDIIFTRPNELHSFSFPKKCIFERQFFHIYPDYIKDFPEITELIKHYHGGCKNYIPAQVVQQYDLPKIFAILRQYNDSTNPETHAVAYSCAILLMVKMNEILRTIDFDALRPPGNPTIRKILDFIDSALVEKLTLDNIAKATFLSPVYLSSLFKKEMGMTIKDYINMNRILLAKNRILNGEKISSLYHKCGFNDYSTFYRAFLKYVKMSPDEFKKQTSQILL